MEDSRAARHDRCVFCVVVFGFGPFFRYVAPTVLRVSMTVPARIAISHIVVVLVTMRHGMAIPLTKNALQLLIVKETGSGSPTWMASKIHEHQSRIKLLELNTKSNNMARGKERR